LKTYGFQTFPSEGPRQAAGNKFKFFQTLEGMDVSKGHLFGKKGLEKSVRLQDKKR